MTDSSKDEVKKYKYWTVTVAQNQSYLGRCVIWCEREDAIDLVDAKEEEIEEFFMIIRSLKNAIEEAFDADWMNYSFLGNGTRHLHCHLVPRYKNKREFNGKTFTDERWGNNFLTNLEFITTKDDREKIKNKIIEYLK